MALVTCRGLEVGYGEQALLPPVDVALEAGTFCVVVGRNGAGKSTWLRTVLGLIPPVRGDVSRAPALRVAYIPQRTAYDAIFPLSAADVVRQGALRGTSFLRWARPSSTATRVALESMGVWPVRDQPFRSLSEGQKQRVLFARVLVGQADLVFMDEPTASMDVVAERELLTLVDRLRRERTMSLVMVTQELTVAAEYADKVMLVDACTRTVVCGAPRDVLSGEPFRKVYGDDKSRDLLAHLGRAPRGGAAERVAP